MRIQVFGLLCIGLVVACSGGGPKSADAGFSCPSGLTDCGGVCVDTDIDGANCGVCGTSCDAGEVCNGAGVCELTCQSGLIDCGGTCTDPNTDRAFCGATGDCMAANAGTACDAGEVCNGSGVCELSCQSGFIDCGGTCIDPNTDELFCGATGDCLVGNAGMACGSGELCNGAGSCELSCQAGLIDCGGTCTDTQIDPDNCGMCNIMCDEVEACAAGNCMPLANIDSCKAYFDAGQNTNGTFIIDPDGIGPLPERSVYCDMDAGGHTVFSQTHDWGEWGAGMTIVMRDRLTDDVGTEADWIASCQLFGKARYTGGWKNTGQTYSLPQYNVYADSQNWWNNHAKEVFPSVDHNGILILQDSLSLSCWAHYAEAGSLQSFGSPTGGGFAFCRGGNTAAKRYHIYLCLP